jgi:hypothetical protein
MLCAFCMRANHSSCFWTQPPSPNMASIAAAFSFVDQLDAVVVYVKWQMHSSGGSENGISIHDWSLGCDMEARHRIHATNHLTTTYSSTAVRAKTTIILSFEGEWLLRVETRNNGRNSAHLADRFQRHLLMWHLFLLLHKQLSGITSQGKA